MMPPEVTRSPASDPDPMPQPPEAPDLDACCGSGCDPCIFDAHDLAMDDYRQALRAWQARQARPMQPQAEGGGPAAAESGAQDSKP